MSSKRDNKIDLLKGIGALSVIIGHLVNYNGLLKTYIYAFHMPLFFFLTGYVYSNKQEKFKTYFYKKSKRILLPYIIYNILSLLLNTYLGTYIFSEKKEIFKGIFYTSGQIPWNSSLWFLPVIFWCYLLLYLLKNQKINNKKIIMILCLIVAIVFSKYNIILPFGLHIVPMSMFFVISANIIKEYDFRNKKLLIISILIFIHFAYLNKRVNISTNVYNNYLLYIIVAFSAINILFFIANIIKKNNIIERFGHYSLFMFCTQRMLFVIYNKFGIVTGANNYFINFYLIIVTIIIYYLLIIFFDKLKKLVIK